MVLKICVSGLLVVRQRMLVASGVFEDSSVEKRIVRERKETTLGRVGEREVKKRV